MSSRTFATYVSIIVTFLTLQQASIINAFSFSSSLKSNKEEYPIKESAAYKLKKVCQEAKDERKSVVLPGIHDALSAKIFANAGAKALFLSGFGVSASKLGEPDVGLLTQTEMESALRLVVQAVSSTSTPVIVDGDTGYGGAMNIRRTIQSFASSGAAAITIEDQEFPKKCTYAAGKGVKVVSFDECRARIKAAIAARDEVKIIDGHDVLIVARTDCRAALGLEEAIARCQMFEKEGADICYAENLQSKDEYISLQRKLNPSTLTMLAQVQLNPNNNGCESDQIIFDAKEVGEMGFDLALFGVTPLQSFVHTMKSCASKMLGSSENGLVEDNQFTAFSELKEVIGFPEAERFESMYRSNKMKKS